MGYIAYSDPTTEVQRVGLYNAEKRLIQPLSFVSGTPVTNIYQIIEAGEEHFAPTLDTPIALQTVQVLPPLALRDVLAVGKNYSEHAKEFNKSGYDSSDKVIIYNEPVSGPKRLALTQLQVDQPSHPVIFTKRATSIIADGGEIFPHSHFTSTLDYEGEIGVIIGKGGFRITEEDAINHVWGYTIINDVTARERQRDHKQFYIGKSADTFCPMGPIAVPAHQLPKLLSVETRVNGELRQKATTEDLIFSIPLLIKTLSEGATLKPGDVIATGTPAGVGFGQDPPSFLQPGDEISVSVTGLGVLRNTIAGSSAPVDSYSAESSITLTNAARNPGRTNLIQVNGKQLHYRQEGPADGDAVIFIHGLGGTLEYWTPLTKQIFSTGAHSLHLYDLEGHGLSPTSPLSPLSISTFASDLGAIFTHANASRRPTLIAHSMGCLVALAFAITNPTSVERLVLIGPPPSPLPETVSKATHTRATIVRKQGMDAVVDTVATSGTSEYTKSQNTLALAALRMSLLAQDPEGYAKGCTALANAIDTLDVGKITAETLIITGEEDKVSPPALCEQYAKTIPNARRPVVLKNVGHWHVFEDASGVANAIQAFLGEPSNGVK